MYILRNKLSKSATKPLQTHACMQISIITVKTVYNFIEAYGMDQEPVDSYFIFNLPYTTYNS